MRACRYCKAIVYENLCHICGNKDLTNKFSGMILIINKEKSTIAKILNLDNGEWAATIED